MKKQEAIEKLKKQLILNSEIVGSEFDKGYNHAIKIAIATVVKLDESEKAVIPRYVADWLEVCKENLAINLANTMSQVVMANRNQPQKVKDWFKSPSKQETFAKAWLYGYEVKKEKLYRVRNKLTNSYLYKIGKGWSHTWDKNQGKSLPKESWVELGVWDSEVYEREEV